MSFGSPMKIFSPNNTNQIKPFSSFPPNMPIHNTQLSNKPKAVSMGVMINNVALKIFTDFHQLVDLLPSKDDADKKTEIAQFLNKTRYLFIRLQALNKWTPSAQKVDKCEKISNLLDEQSLFLMKTAEDLSILARDKLPYARLQNILPIISADVFATKTYSRLPNIIKFSVLKSQRINKLDKIRMFDELNRILRIRLSNSKIPYRMRNIDISNGRVTFIVPDEFTVTCTLMSDHFDHPWRLLNINFLVKGNNVCRGRSLVHNNQLKAMHEIIQIRLNSHNMSSSSSLYYLYDMMHSMSIYLQLDVLHEQINDYIRHGHGIPIYDVRYTKGSRLTFSYWHRSEKYIQRPKHSIVICNDEDDSKRPLKVRHLPAICADCKYTEKILDISNLSIKNLIAESIVDRVYSTLKMVQRLLFPFNDSICVSAPNPVLLIPILTSNNKENNYIKIQIHASTGYVKTSFKMPFDFLNRYKESKIVKLLSELDTDINELLLKTFTSLEAYDSKKVINSENRELVNHRRNIANSMNKLRITLTKYECLTILQNAGFKDLHLYLNRPPICRENYNEKIVKQNIYELFNQEKKGDCELLYISINYEWNYFLIIVCETKYRMIPSYRLFVLNTTKVWTVATSAPYSEKIWLLKPVKLTPLTEDAIKKIANIKKDNFKLSNIRKNLKREAVTCVDLLHKIQNKKLKLDSGESASTENTGIEETADQMIINNLPTIVGYMRSNIVFKLLIHEIERTSIIFNCEHFDDEILIHTCRIRKFPDAKECSNRASVLMNKLLKCCSVTYVFQGMENDGTCRIQWEVELSMKFPFFLFDKSHNSLEMSKKVVLCSKKCHEENHVGIKETVGKLLSFWEEICQFGDCFLLPLFDRQKPTTDDFKLVDYRLNSLVLSYGNDFQYQVVVSYSTSSGFTVLPEISDSHSNKVSLTNPHNLIKKDLVNYMNSHRNIVGLMKMLTDTLEFLTNVCPFSNSNLMVMQDGNYTQMTRNYSLIILEAYHVILIFRERFALHIILNNATQTVQLSDAHKNFHACNMSIKEMPLFDKFMWSLEEAFRMNIEDDLWSGPLVDQLPTLLGCINTSGNHSSPTLLENYLLSALQLGAREEMVCSLPGGREGKIVSGAKLQIELVPREDKSTPFWELQMKKKFDESNLIERPWMLENDLFSLAKTVFESKIRAPKQSETGLNMFKKLIELPNFNLQHNLLKVLTYPPTVLEFESRKLTASIDIDWGSIQEAISYSQDLPNIGLRFILNIKICNQSSVNSILDKSVNLPLILHYMAKTNQIAIVHGTHQTIQRQNFDKEANNSVVGNINGETPLLAFVNKLMSNIKEYLN